MEKCNICQSEQTNISVETLPGKKIYVCATCLKKAEKNFVYFCMECGRSYMRAKKMVIKRLQDPELKRAYALCENEIIIQGIDMCIECMPQEIIDMMPSKGNC